MSDVMARATVEAIQMATDPLHRRIKDLEATVALLSKQAGPEGPPGPQGPPGESIVGPAGEKGANGADGLQGPPGDPGPAGPAGRDGADGAVGPVGPQGEKGLDGIHGKDGAAGLDGKDGAPGAPGRDGMAGRDGLPGPQGEKGLDGKDGRDGIHGKDGVDGFGFDDLSVEHDGERTFTLKFVQGERVKSFAFSVPVMIFRSVFDETKSYTTGDVVQFGGNLYMATTDTTSKPTETGEGAKEWRLVVRRGREGKQGPQGPPGTYEPPKKPGGYR